MGWDVVQLGLKHDLPIDDPQAMAEVLAHRMGCDVQVGYYRYCEYDEARQRAYLIPGVFVPLGAPHKGGSSAYCLRLIISNYWIDEMRRRVALYDPSKVDFQEEWMKPCFLEDLDAPQLYVLEGNENEDGDEIDVRIFREAVGLDLYVIERWSAWARHFESTDEEHWSRLQEYRMQVYERAKVFGCEQVLYFADQGPTELIYDDMDKGAEELLAYVHTRRYLDDSSWIEPEDQAIWRRDGLHIQYADYFKGNIPWRDGVWIEVVFDDFSDLRAAECSAS